MRPEVEKVLDSIRPALQADGGDVELVDIDGGSVRIDGNLPKLVALLDDDNDIEGISGEINEIRILAQEDEVTSFANFYDIVNRDINFNDYEEFMKIKESGQDMRMLVKTEGKRFREFLFIAGGDDNFIIQVKGNLSMSDAKHFSADMKRNHGRDMMEEYN